MRRPIETVCLVLLATLGNVLAIDTLTAVFQQGLDGYIGCEDGYVQVIMDNSVSPAKMDSALSDSNYAGSELLYAQSNS